MRQWSGTAAAAGLLVAMTLHGGALQAATENETPQMLAFGDTDPAANQPVILRGSAVAPKSTRAAAPATPRYQIAAGQRLWFYDPATQDIRSCINRQTSTVGLRIVRCFTTTLGGHRRTFGPDFQP
jgi:hypothetical protein